MISFADLIALPIAPADHGILYGKESGQFGELRLPAGKEIVPLVVLIHGGCWRSQYDLRHSGAAAAALTSEGFATWSIEYRRIGDPGGGWPNTFDDVAHGVDHVRALARQFPRIDTNRVVLMGHSAGGQLALWAASRRQNEQSGLYRSNIPPIPLSGVVSLAGITDLAGYGALPGACNAAVPLLLGGTPAQHPGRYHSASPIERVPIGVPIRLVHGDADPIVLITQSREFLRRALWAEDSVALSIVPGAGHFDLIAPNSDAWTAVLRAVRGVAVVPRGSVSVQTGHP